jgi:WhiB family redox-sensing transcriptional regulator
MTLTFNSGDLASDSSFTPSPTALERSLTDQEPPMNSTASSLRTVGSDDPRSSVVVEPLEPDSPRPPGISEIRIPVARCADGNGTMTGLFFSDNVIDIARAKAMCGLCSLQTSCLAEAIERQEPWGVWGGELISGGRIVINKRACGRPPKYPRPEIVIDELGPVTVVA